MLLFLLACSVGSPDGATLESVSAREADRMRETEVLAGRMAGIARELEAAARSAQQRIKAGADPGPDLANLERLMKEVESMEQALDLAHQDRLQTVRESAQSTFEITR
tara:strand:+ start:294 stop:617 length:324 start_codon:yes stop_codon:yes gene_type:complete